MEEWQSAGEQRVDDVADGRLYSGQGNSALSGGIQGEEESYQKE